MQVKIPDKKYLFILNVILICVILGMLIFSGNKGSDGATGSITRDVNNTYKLTNPILDYENLVSGDETVIPIGLINKKVDEIKDGEGLSHISLYYRDLNNGQWIGVDEKEEFYPASLLKVPTMMAFLKSIESSPEFLNKKQIIPLSEDTTLDQNISFTGTLVSGSEYSFLEIVDSMITKSDNLAANIILENTNSKDVENIFSAVGIPLVDTKTEPIVRVKDYAGFFRVLYNASYLNREMSELALEILSVSEYKNGIVAGVPSGIKVAHKFGERSLIQNGDIKQTQLHDCGIIYYPKKPYILCVMTRGDDFKVQEVAIQALSKFVYDQISK